MRDYDIAIEGLSLSYGEEVVLDEINLNIDGETSTAIIGTSGRGKSTLLRCLAGLPPKLRTGTVSIGGSPPQQRHLARDLWFLFQEPVLFQNRTVFQHLELSFALHGRDVNDDRCLAILANVGLQNSVRKYPHQLSVGMRARLALAMSFCVPPKILFADEPFSSLDSGYRATLNAFLRQMQEDSKTTVVWITHEIWDAIDYADRIIVLAGKPAKVASDIRVRELFSSSIGSVALMREQVHQELLSLIARDTYEA